MQVELRARVVRQGRPVAVDLAEERMGRVGAEFRLGQKRKRAAQIGILHRDAGDVAVAQILDRIHGRGVDPTGARRGDDDERGAGEPADTLELLESELRPRLGAVCTAQPDIDAQRLPGRAAALDADLLGARPAGDEFAPGAAELAPADKGGGAAGLERIGRPGALRLDQGVEFAIGGIEQAEDAARHDVAGQRPEQQRRQADADDVRQPARDGAPDDACKPVRQPLEQACDQQHQSEGGEGDRAQLEGMRSWQGRQLEGRPDRVLPIRRLPQEQQRNQQRQQQRRCVRQPAQALGRSGQFEIAPKLPRQHAEAIADREADSGQRTLRKRAARDQRRRQCRGEEQGS